MTKLLPIFLIILICSGCITTTGDKIADGIEDRITTKVAEMVNETLEKVIAARIKKLEDRLGSILFGMAVDKTKKHGGTGGFGALLAGTVVARLRRRWLDKKEKV